LYLQGPEIGKREFSKEKEVWSLSIVRKKPVIQVALDVGEWVRSHERV
jgi:hypothetical protein